jgi:acetyl-CoA synthetase
MPLTGVDVVGMSQSLPEVEPSLSAYRFYEEEWDGYEDLYDSFEWEMPETFNMARYTCDRWAEAAPDRVALYAREGDGTAAEYTFGWLDERASQLASCLADEGISAGDRVAVNGSQKADCVVAMFAGWKLGAIVVPMSMLYGPEALEYRLANSGATAYVVDEASVPTLRGIIDDLPDLKTVLTVGDPEPLEEAVDLRAAMEDRPTDFETEPTASSDTATILYTSGTTGPPKGVKHAHDTLLGLLPSYVTSVCDNKIGHNVVRGPAELSWTGTLYNALLPSFYYGTSYVIDAHPQYDPERELETVDMFDITTLGGPATAFRMMMQIDDVEGRYDLSSTDVVLAGAESLGQSIVDWMKETMGDVAVHELYGQTEAPLVVADVEALGVDHVTGAMGKALPGHEVDVLERDAPNPVPAGETGEIAVRYDDPICFETFWNDDSKTRERIDDGWLRTGDIGTKDENGYFRFEARKDDLIISSGYRIGPAEVEESLATHAAVADAGVIGVPHETRGEVPKAFVVPADGHDTDEELRETLASYVKSELAKYKYPREVEFVAELPTTSTGKLQRRDLRQREGLVD